MLKKTYSFWITETSIQKMIRYNLGNVEYNHDTMIILNHNNTEVIISRFNEDIIKDRKYSILLRSIFKIKSFFYSFTPDHYYISFGIIHILYNKLIIDMSKERNIHSEIKNKYVILKVNFKKKELSSDLENLLMSYQSKDEKDTIKIGHIIVPRFDQELNLLLKDRKYSSEIFDIAIFKTSLNLKYFLIKENRCFLIPISEKVTLDYETQILDLLKIPKMKI